MTQRPSIEGTGETSVPSAVPPVDVARPVAAVLVESGLPHLDRVFEYAVPPDLDELAQPGVRVNVRFAGQELRGYVVERRAEAEHDGRLAPLKSVVAGEAVLTPPILELARDLAATHAGVTGDVLRLAIPPRHARAEKALAMEPPALDPLPVAALGDGAWANYRGGSAFLEHVRDGAAVGAVWSALPVAGDPARDWPAAFAAAAAACVAGGRGALLVVPDHRDLERLDAAVGGVLGPGRHVRLSADQGPQARYTAWLKVLRGHVPVVIGTRAAAYAPMPDLGLIAVWDDGDDLYDEPRAPYPHVRDVVANRARIEGCSLLLGAYARSVADESLVEAGVLQPIVAPRKALRDNAPRVVIAGEETERERDPAATSARLPTLAWRTAKAALERGPVLIQVPRRGYVPSLACQQCRARARCTACHGPLALSGGGQEASCRWCGTIARDWECPECGGSRLRSLVVGARRTAEELGRAFPGVPVMTSGGDAVLASVPGRPALVISTPGAEPVAEGGYAAALLLDAWALLDRPALDAAPEALRRWMAAAALVRPAAAGGMVVVTGVSPGTTAPALEALIRWDAAWLAAGELAERRLLHLPPADIFAEVVGTRGALEAIATREGLPAGVTAYGPTRLPGVGPAAGVARSGAGGGDSGDLGLVVPFRLLLRARPQDVDALATVLRQVRAERSARKETDTLRVRMGVADVN